MARMVFYAKRIYKNKKETAALKKGKGHDKSGTHGRRKVYYVITCNIHGKLSRINNEKLVFVSPVHGRKAKYQGCPLCKAGK